MRLNCPSRSARIPFQLLCRLITKEARTRRASLNNNSGTIDHGYLIQISGAVASGCSLTWIRGGQSPHCLVDRRVYRRCIDDFAAVHDRQRLVLRLLAANYGHVTLCQFRLHG
jgi:hypothetical protein